ncbi:hypothetical protein HCG51_10780 [Tolypothrix sp. PCC 7910]|uniref:hypothetical protein n=1 Tax=Tolypothrix sp. PCC 7910 TaxID=2099387 RepID=UPI0014277F56|nr:hypothetical protein [Tolypothrix sp. PCC 7910]QIR35275.1 hypothetical protein HCG51_10780 [Tolypothrix sp. PCC 7910]
MGYEPLRQAIAFYLARSRAVQAQDCQQMQEICDRISRVYSSGLEESVQKFLESLGKLKRAYFTGLEEKVLRVLESEI